MIRFTVFDRWGRQTGVLNDVIEAVHKDEVNGEDSLTIMLASCHLTKGDRIVWRDKFGEWHEHIVNDLQDVHDDGKLYTVAYCENSIAELYTDYVEERRPYNTGATVALERALGTSRWEVGTVTVTTVASASLYHVSAREAITEIIENWGGEFTTTIEIDGAGVSRRKVNLLQRRGQDNGKRFEWSKDVAGITREVSVDDVCTALYGYGKGLEAYDEDGNLTGGFERKLTFGEINGGLDYVADEQARLTWGLPDGDGGIKHTFGRVEFPECEDMDELLELTKTELATRCVPQVTYIADVIDLADAGFEFEDVRTGDSVALVDRELGVRLTGRATCVERHLFNDAATVVTFGNVSHGMSDVVMEARMALAKLGSHATFWDSTAMLTGTYIDRVIGSLNNTMNQTGGYTYYEPGEGIITYDRPRDQNPTMAVQIKGAGIRIANSKKSNGDWNWRTFGTGDGFTADLMVAGAISDSRGANYWNLETGELRMSVDATLGGKTVQEVLKDVASTITNVDVQYAEGESNTTAPTIGWSSVAPAWRQGYYIWQRTATTTQLGTTYSDPACISGREGIDGTSVLVVSVQYGISADTTTEPTSWSNNSPQTIPQGSWLWVKTTYSDSRYTITKSYEGKDGETGEDGTGITSIAEQYYLSTSSTTQAGGSWQAIQPEWQSGRYIWTRSAITWDTTPATITYTAPVLASALNQANRTAKEASDGVNKLGTQQGVFNALTNNGEVQGIYMSGGQLYVNGEYIKADTVSAHTITDENNLGEVIFAQPATAMTFGSGLSFDDDVADEMSMANVSFEDGIYMGGDTVAIEAKNLLVCADVTDGAWKNRKPKIFYKGLTGFVGPRFTFDGHYGMYRWMYMNGLLVGAVRTSYVMINGQREEGIEFKKLNDGYCAFRADVTGQDVFFPPSSSGTPLYDAHSDYQRLQNL